MDVSCVRLSLHIAGLSVIDFPALRLLGGSYRELASVSMIKAKYRDLRKSLCCRYTQRMWRMICPASRNERYGKYLRQNTHER